MPGFSANKVRIYHRAECVVFRKTSDEFGGLSNMAGGFPLAVNDVEIRTSEALYQACRFPHLPDVQTLILEQRSPMAAKMVGKPHSHDSRPDWDAVRVTIMRWCLRVKLAQNSVTFSELLSRTGGRPIVEDSRRDDFWGAKSKEPETLVGMNVLGRLLMELRQQLREQAPSGLLTVEPPPLQDFLLKGSIISSVSGLAAQQPQSLPLSTVPFQQSLFDAS